MSPSRVLVGVLAVVLCAAFIVGVRQAHSSNALNAMLATGDPLTPTQQRSAASDLSSARFGYPGQDVQILAAQLALREHHFARAELISLAITRAEPDNLQGWLVLAAAALIRSDRATLLRAKREEIRLDPVDVRP
jgi:hypothetical protein